MLMAAESTAFGMSSQPHSVDKLQYRIRMSERNTRKQLWDNVSALMQKHYGGENLTRLAKEAKFGPDSATRLKEQNTSVGIDILDKLAKLFKVEPWELLAPGIAAQVGQAAGPLTPRARQSNESVGRQNLLTEHMVALELAIDALAPLLTPTGREALRRWAGGEIRASDAAATLEELAVASRAIAAQKKPNGSGGPIGMAA